MDEQKRVNAVQRKKICGLKTCLRAAETIPANSFLFYNFSEMIDMKKDNEAGHRSPLEAKIDYFGAGKVFLLAIDKNTTDPCTYEEAKNDPKWDFRFMNYSAGQLAIRRKWKSNVELREECLVKFEDGEKKVRAFYSTEAIEKGAELLWDYIYHKKKSTKLQTSNNCSCGIPEQDCRVLNLKKGHDYNLEKIYKHIGKNSEGNRRYFVKWKDYDIVNNSWVEETELAGIGIFSQYEKIRRKADRKKIAYRTIKCGADTAVYNADSSSGEEDDRVNITSAAPMKIIHVCEETINGKRDVVCYVKFSNWEMHRMRKSRIQRKCPQLLIQYYESIIKFTGKRYGNILKRPREEEEDEEALENHSSKRQSIADAS